MLGAIIGDTAGSRFEFHNHRSKDFELLAPGCGFTDDSVMTFSVADALLNCSGDYADLSAKTVESMHRIGRCYPDAGYGGRFYGWMFSDDPHPYNSYGNGSAMRVSPVAWVAKDLEECKKLSLAVTAVSHNHPEGIKGAEATAVAIFMALHGADKDDICREMTEHYYPLDFSIDEIRPTYRFNETCQNTVPQALEAFLESEDYEDCVRIAVSLGGDSDTLAAIAGSIAEAYYGIPAALREKEMGFLDDRLKGILERFEVLYPPKIL